MGIVVVLSASDRALYTTRLREAQAAYHQIIMGGGVKVFVDQNGERVEYNQGSIRGLTAYIAELRRLLGLGEALGPLNIWF